MATDPPGFALDESQETMGEKLKLPEQNEPQREEMKKVLLPFEVREVE
jgi:glyoxalase family protein